MKRDHPRVCGEKMHPKTSDSLISGSPPRMRGKAIDRHFPEPCFGITPAYAGKRGRNKSGQPAAKDHPRVCGEKYLSILRQLTPLGSPPRMRGKDDYKLLRKISERITPAYAGKRLKRSRSTVPPVAIVPLFPSVCNKPVVSDGSPAGRDAPLFLPAENAVPASPAYNLRSL